MDYEPNFMDLLTASTDEDARAKAQIMAEQLRGDKQLGLMGKLGGKRAAGLGQEMLSDADMAEKGLLTAGVNRLHFGQQAQDLKRQALMAGIDKAMSVQDAKNRGALDVMQERNRGAYDVAQLRALAGPKPKALSYGEVKDVQRLNTELGSLNDLDTRFKDDYAGKGPLGAMIVRGKKMLGSSASPAAQEEAAYWADYQRLVDIPQRHEKFGSALTPGESRIWESARNLGPTSDPKIVKATIASMKGILSRHLDSWKESRAEAGYSEKQLAPLIKEASPAAPSGKIKKYNPTTDQFE